MNKWLIVLPLVCAFGCGDKVIAPIPKQDAPPVYKEVATEDRKLKPMPTKGGSSDFLPPPGQRRFFDHRNELVRTMPKGFHMVERRPFFVLSDLSKGELDNLMAHVLDPTLKAYRKDFFTSDPHDPIDIWLFAGKESYEKHAKRLFGEDPGTPYGFYSSTERAMVMNIATGGGTLLHELVHAFMDDNFPNCPPWFNEGLGSLFEQAVFDNGRVFGQTNWRLAGLQEAIKARNLPAFKALCELDDEGFYERDPGTNYSQSRYLLLFLQERDLLVPYYQLFFASRTEDPTGYESLKEILELKDLEDFQIKWEKWVLELRFP